MKTFYREFATLMNFLYWLPMFISVAIVIALSTVIIWWGGDYFKIKKIYKIIANVIAVALAVFIVPLHWTVPAKQAQEKRIVEYNEQKEKYEQAKAVFDEQCKKAGEKIYRTVDNVDGVMLLNLIGEKEKQEFDPMWEDAAINHILLSPYTAEKYIETFLSYDIDYNIPEQKYHSWTNGYQFVDVLEKDNNIDTSSITRYTRLTPVKDSELKKEFQPINPARYIVILEKNVDPELRKHWVAGASIKIIDRQTDVLLAEKTIFAFDPLQGATSDRGAPWSRADICQEMDEIKRQGTYVFISPISNFVFTVLNQQPLFMETENER